MNLISSPNLPSLKIYLYLVPKRDRELLKNYLIFIYWLFNRCFNKKNIKHTNFLYLMQLLSKDIKKDNLLSKLQQDFIKENLSLSLLLEPLEGFLWIKKNTYQVDYVKSTPMLLQIISPISRLIAVLNNEEPILYAPLSNIIFAYFSLYLRTSPSLIEALKNNNINLNQEELSSHLNHLFIEEKQILRLKTNIIFKLKLCVLIGLYKILITNPHKNINFFTYVNSFLYGLFYKLTIQRKNTNII